MSGEQNDFISQVNQAHNASEQNYQEAYEQNAQIKHESAQATASRDEKLRRINSWREQYKSQLAPSPLEDITKLSAQLELTHAHPSGIAQLFASGKVTLQALFRDSGMLRAAGRRLDRVFEDRDNKAHEMVFRSFRLLLEWHRGAVIMCQF